MIPLEEALEEAREEIQKLTAALELARRTARWDDRSLREEMIRQVKKLSYHRFESTLLVSLIEVVRIIRETKPV